MSIIREPVVIINIVKAVLTLLVAFGIALSGAQQDAVLNFAAAALALLAIFGVGAKLERDRVTPIAAPHLPEGTVVSVYDENSNVTSEKVV